MKLIFALFSLTNIILTTKSGKNDWNINNSNYDHERNFEDHSWPSQQNFLINPGLLGRNDSERNMPWLQSNINNSVENVRQNSIITPGSSLTDLAPSLPVVSEPNSHQLGMCPPPWGTQIHGRCPPLSSGEGSSSSRLIPNRVPEPPKPRNNLTQPDPLKMYVKYKRWILKLHRIDAENYKVIEDNGYFIYCLKCETKLTFKSNNIEEFYKHNRTHHTNKYGRTEPVQSQKNLINQEQPKENKEKVTINFLSSFEENKNEEKTTIDFLKNFG
uniref:Uncharacterized protein n=1 Tax=Meloidogyne enterolobii TaxID=390850 RepID=A0A6V7VQ59_MELEN|nr:unnamed protein product [Meloidogyne enterolobii]